MNIMRIFILGSFLMVCDIVFADYNIAVLGKDTINGAPVILIDDVSTNFLDDGFNFLGVIGFFLGLASLYFAKVTFEAQKQTALHTSNAPKSAQMGKLKDLPRHFYRNLVCTCSQIFLFNDKSNKDSSGRRICYPSESNVMKLQTLPDDIILPIDAGNAEVYKSMHELRLLFRNYSQEVAVAAEHLSRANITDKSLYQDFDNLLFKPMFLTYKTFDFESCLDGKDSGSHKVFLYDRARTAMVREHFAKLKDNALILLDRTRLDYLSRLLPGLEVGDMIGDEVFDADVVMSIGGDGTFLRTAAKIGARQVPIVGINTGHLGYLSEVAASDFDLLLEEMSK